MKLTGYQISRDWFDFAFENPELVKPNHTALYFFAVEHCNRLGWKKKFGLPTGMAMEAIGIKSHNTYMKAFNDLVDFGFIKLIEKSKNQYSSNIVALSKYEGAMTEKEDSALSSFDKALIKHASKQRESTHQSIDSIYKHITNNNITINEAKKIKSAIDEFLKKNDIEEKITKERTVQNGLEKRLRSTALKPLDKVFIEMDSNLAWKEQMCMLYSHKIKGVDAETRMKNFDKLFDRFYNHLKIEHQENEKSISDTYRHFSNWIKKIEV